MEENVYLVAISANTEADVHNLLDHMGDSEHRSVIHEWWVAEDNRTDRSDNDSAIFVPMGSQDHFRSQVEQWFDANEDLIREDGLPWADTDVSGVHRGTTPPDTDASHGEAWIVEISHNTDENNVLIPEGEPAAITLHGTFDTEEEAEAWVEAYPEDTDIEDFRVLNINRVKDK